MGILTKILKETRELVTEKTAGPHLYIVAADDGSSLGTVRWLMTLAHFETLYNLLSEEGDDRFEPHVVGSLPDGFDWVIANAISSLESQGGIEHLTQSQVVDASDDDDETTIILGLAPELVYEKYFENIGWQGASNWQEVWQRFGGADEHNQEQPFQ